MIYKSTPYCGRNSRLFSKFIDEVLLYVSLVADHRQNYSLKADFQQCIAPPKTVTHILGFFQSEIQSQLPLSINLSSIEQQLHSQSGWGFPEMENLCGAPHKFRVSKVQL